MALFADGITASSRQFRRVYEVDVLRRFTVTPGTLNAVNDLPVTVESPGLERRAGRVTVQATGRDRATQVGLGVTLITGGEIPGVAVRIITNRRLVKVLLVLEREAAAHAPRADKQTQIDFATGPDRQDVR